MSEADRPHPPVGANAMAPGKRMTPRQRAMAKAQDQAARARLTREANETDIVKAAASQRTDAGPTIVPDDPSPEVPTRESAADAMGGVPVTEAVAAVAAAAVAPTAGAGEKAISGYGSGGVETVISVEEVTRQVAAIADGVTPEHLDTLAGADPYVTIEGLRAGYGKMEILHDIHLRVGRRQSLCLIGPNGAGKSTVLHAIFGFNNIFDGAIRIGDGAEKRDVTKLSPNQKLAEAGIAYILQDKSVFPGMTVEENLWMGGFLKDQPAEAKRAAEMVFDKYPRLAARRRHQAKVLSGGERRLLEISRALVMNPEVLLVDEPSIGLEPRFIDMVFEILHGLQHDDGKTIIMVEQNAKKGLEFADIGYVLVSGQIAIADTGDNLLANPKVGELFLGG